MTYTSENFFEATKANYASCARPEREADYVSRSGSAYWYTENGVIRESNHWGRAVATCEWTLDGCWYGYDMRCGYPMVREDGTRYMQMVEPWCEDAGRRFDAICGFCEWTAFEAA